MFTNVNSALINHRNHISTLNFIAGLGGRDISKDDIEGMFLELIESMDTPAQDRVRFVNLNLSEPTDQIGE
jgi:pyruvate ferredoxin oxidoreductase alpha subunit